MSTSIDPQNSSRHRLLAETRPKMARADLRKPETDEWREELGRAIQRVIALRGWSLKEFAAAVERDERQCARWITGAERPQFDAVLAVESLRQLLIVALAEIAGAGVELETTVRIRRTA